MLLRIAHSGRCGGVAALIAAVLLVGGGSTPLMAAVAAEARNGEPIDRSELRPHAVRARGGYHVRMGAFENRAAAQDVAADLRRVTDEPVEVADFGVGAGRAAVRLYRVHIGPIRSRAAALELVAALKDLGYGAAPVAAAPETEPAAAPKAASTSTQQAVGPQLVDVPVEPAREVTRSATPGTRQSRSVAAPELEAPFAEEAPPAPEDAISATTADSPADATAAAGDKAVTAVDAPPAPRGEEAFVTYEDGRRFLQMGAYLIRRTANERAARLRRLTAEQVAVTEIAGDDGTPLYRVRIGPVESDASLAGLEDALRDDDGVLRRTARNAGVAFVVLDDSEHFVQVAAYGARDTADSHAIELAGQIDAEVRVAEVQREGAEPMYRVRIGPLKSDAALMALVEALESLGYAVD